VNDIWEVRFSMDVVITHYDVKFFDHDARNEKIFSWKALPIDPVKVKVWVPIQQTGTYAITAMKIADGYPVIPHINSYAACMSLGDAPKQIMSNRDFVALKHSVARCMQGVQLDSLRTSINEWYETFKLSMPEDLRKALRKDWNWGNAVKLAQETLKKNQEAAAAGEQPSTETEVVTTAEEARSTWSV
jgi:hypothetical protein